MLERAKYVWDEKEEKRRGEGTRGKKGKSNVICHLSFGVYDVCLEWG